MEADARQGISFDEQPKRAELPAKKAARAIAKTSVISPLGEDPREADALPWEKGKKKPA